MRWAVVSGWFVVALAGAATAAPTVAMNGHMPSSSDLDGMAALGVTAVRVDFNWFQFEPAPGIFAFDDQDAVVAGANSRGIGVYATIAYTPQWASSVPSCTQSAPDPTATCNNKIPANASDWTTAVTTVVTRYAGKVECWGIWNEPNLQGFFDGSEDDFVNDIFVPAANAIRAADPQAKICGPELAGLTDSSSWNGKNGTCTFGTCIRNGWEIDLGDMLDRVGGSIDVITQHMYKGDAAGVVSALIDGEYFGNLLIHDSVKNVIAAHGGAGKPVWLTESGWEHTPQGSFSDTDVATRIVDLYSDQEQVCAGTYSASSNVPWSAWARTYYFHYPYDPNSGWGIIDSTGAPLPEYTALQGWTNGRTTTACGTGVAAPDAGVPDAGAPDAGPAVDAGSDAGSSAVPDAGASRDAGTVQPASDAGSPAGTHAPPPSGCGCDGAGAGPLTELLLLLSLLTSRGRPPPRKRGHRGRGR